MFFVFMNMCYCNFRCLDQVGRAGECSMEFLSLYRKMIQPTHWKHYLALKGVLLKLGDLITTVRVKVQGTV